METRASPFSDINLRLGFFILVRLLLFGSASPLTCSQTRPLHLLPLPYTQLRRVVCSPAALIYHSIYLPFAHPCCSVLLFCCSIRRPCAPPSCLIKASLRCAPPVYTPFKFCRRASCRRPLSGQCSMIHLFLPLSRSCALHPGARTLWL